MALPKKGTRALHVRGTRYRWMVRRNGKVSHGNVLPVTFHLTVEAPSGALLLARFGGQFHGCDPSAGFQPAQNVSVTSGVARAVVEYALDTLDWQYARSSERMTIESAAELFPQAILADVDPTFDPSRMSDYGVVEVTIDRDCDES